MNPSKKIRILNYAIFGLLVCLLFLYGQINWRVYFTITCILLPVFTSGILVDFLIVKKRIKKSNIIRIFLSIIGLISGFLSGRIIGVQTHDVHDGGPSFGMAIWPLTLGIIYPICFSVFIYTLSFFKRRTILILLFVWIAMTAGYSSFSDYRNSFSRNSNDKRRYYDAEYFPSETKAITPLILGTTSLWTIILLIGYFKRNKTFSVG